MWAACLWDEWSSPDGRLGFRSFALVTGDAPPEVAAAGHDRCPVFLREDVVDRWLDPRGMTAEEAMELLGELEPAVYEHRRENLPPRG